MPPVPTGHCRDVEECRNCLTPEQHQSMGCDYPGLGFGCHMSWRQGRTLVEHICALSQRFGLIPKCAGTSPSLLGAARRHLWGDAYGDSKAMSPCHDPSGPVESHSLCAGGVSILAVFYWVLF